MEYYGNLIIIGVYFMLEVKFDEQIRATCGTWSASSIKAGTKLMHSIWQLLGRFVFLCAIIWNQPMDNEITALATFLMYALFYWVAFDSIFARGVLKRKPWYLGTTSAPDKWVPKKLHFVMWVLKWAAFAGSVYWVYLVA